jgi:arabinose-5-phosphate isomerase
VVKGDVCLALSHSGDTEEIIALLPLVRRLGCPLIAITGNPKSELARSADVHLDTSIRQEACPLGLAPTASTTAALAMGDALAMALLERRGFTVEDFATLHPAGGIGRKLQRVRDLMHSGDEVPRVLPDTPMKDVLFEMTRKRLGVTAVAEADGRLLGVISDGDLRRQMERHGYGVFDTTARTCMTPDPVLVEPEALAVRALELMEQRRITSLLVADRQGRIEGVVHLHDLWRTQLV